ncbi:MAG: hypothetical protein ACD_37C00049G0001 [uncultured bacterium]|nr:MAG: hypothetical protein ACD_37C00049G0001 [uncultured bacterium]KKR17581.1 MAG: HAD-superfamily hydrolase, subfamily IA [Candidatus Levybacteria bacterium GW2011_GWA1_39_32]KKR51482.1 MAG: HAD-superfamily hydrolase, subfamily IA [Candidatus Levybacteria bacterium GW2011_GWC1_40_19]KKR73566.1 MAG: HAD-superfamily hydrolase, subfamily IA [Candidatus Levybacteria bacterium GW2011_GWC2_40_7]KKR95453.1 MAG: HAD-superfamily hydrolase, subfamily IA [Candidatus Levybacteria bacterium GW2011_GWA2_4
MLKAVLFDVDGVLLDSFEANLKFYQDLMKHAGHRSPTREEYRPFFHLSMRDLIPKFSGLTEEDEINKIWEIGRKREVRYPDELVKMPSDIEEAIGSLGEKYILGIVTGRVKENILKTGGLEKLKKLFTVVVGYQDTENHKPDPEPLLFACKKLKIKPSEAVYVGDAEGDITAGKSAGMKTILFHPDNKFDNADAHASSFKDLPGVIEAISHSLLI